MIDVAVKLKAWAIWAVRRADGGSLASFAQYGYAETVGSRAPSGFAPADADGVIFVRDEDGRDHVIDHEEIRKLDDVIENMVSLSTRQLLKVWYLNPGTQEQKARDLGCTRMTVWRRLKAGQIELGIKLAELRHGIKQRGVQIKMREPMEAANQNY